MSNKYDATLEGMLEPETTALLVIDPQVDYCSPKGKIAKLRGYDTKPIEEMLPRLGGFVNELRKYGVPIIWTKMDETPEHMPENFRRKMEASGKALALCTPGTPGYEYYLIKPDFEMGDKEILKNQYDSFSNPELNEYLREKNIKTLIFSGVYTSRCVASTLLSAAREGYNCVLLEDLVAMTAAKQHQEAHKVALSELDLLFAYVVKSDDVLKILENSKAPI